MANVTFSGGEFLNIVTIPITGDVWKDSQSIYESSHAAVVLVNSVVFSFEGSGFDDFDSRGYALAGTINQFKLAYAGVDMTWSGLSLSAASVEDWFKHGRAETLTEALFAGDDTIKLNKGGAIVDAYDGDDTVIGGRGDDSIYGGRGDDVIKSGNGPAFDFMTGGLGADTLFGGEGANTFDYNSLSESHKGAIDTIADLRPDGPQTSDTIDVSDIDANTMVGGDQAFSLAGDSFTGSPGQLIVFYEAGRDRTVIEGDVDGDKRADLIIYATGDHATFDGFEF